MQMQAPAPRSLKPITREAKAEQSADQGVAIYAWFGRKEV